MHRHFLTNGPIICIDSAFRSPVNHARCRFQWTTASMPPVALPPPPGTIPTGRERHQVALTGIDASKEGADWTADGVAVLVGSYFLMLAEERAGREYNKSEYRRSVIAAIGRKPGSIE